ncbi:MAG: hypothetical protein WBA57_12550 [Elainellaceae cyanobacterium]
MRSHIDSELLGYTLATYLAIYLSTCFGDRRIIHHFISGINIA